MLIWIYDDGTGVPVSRGGPTEYVGTRSRDWRRRGGADEVSDGDVGDAVVQW